jgi:hypothetical protein
LFPEGGGPKFSYITEKLGMRSISFHQILSEDRIREMKPVVGTWNGLKTIFPVPGKADFPFDLLAGVFYLLTRYEEYLPFKGDKYGRFPAEESIAFQNGFLEQAIIDRWL